MLNSITSPLDGIRSPFGAIRNPFAAYAIGGQTPQTIADFSVDVYRANSTSTTAASLLTHTRAGTATFTDSTGTLQTAATNELRKDNHIWDGSSWIKRCLVEPQSTNLFTYSEDFTDASWAVSGGATLTASGVTDPSGNTNAFSIETDGTIVEYLDTGNLTVTASATVSLSFFLKQGTAPKAYIQINGSTGGTTVASYVVFDFSTRTVASIQAVTGGGLVNPTAVVEEYGSDWTRVTLSGGIGTSNTQARGFVGPTDSDTTRQGTSGEDIIVFGAQLEESSVPTSYIPTAGATVTRPADALSIDSTLLPYDSTAMTIAMAYNITGDDGTLFNWEADANNKITASVASGTYTFTQIAAGTSDSVTGGTLADGTNTAASVASRHTSSDINGAVDGTALTADTTPTVLPDLSATDFQIAPTGVFNIKSLRILGGYGATDAELEAATS